MFAAAIGHEGIWIKPTNFSPTVFINEISKPISVFEEYIHPKGDPAETFTVGAFSSSGDDLIGVATLKRDLREVGRHKALLTSMYVVAEARGT